MDIVNGYGVMTLEEPLVHFEHHSGHCVLGQPLQGLGDRWAVECEECPWATVARSVVCHPVTHGSHAFGHHHRQFNVEEHWYSHYGFFHQLLLHLRCPVVIHQKHTRLQALQDCNGISSGPRVVDHKTVSTGALQCIAYLR